MPFLNIHDNHYFRGSYLRKNFQGYLYYDTYRFKEIEASRSDSILHFTDHLFLTLCGEYQISYDVYQGYTEAAKQMLADDALWDSCYEEIYDQIYQLRMTYVPESVAADYRRRLAIGLENVKVPIYNGINQTELFQKVFRQKNTVLLTVSEITLLPLAATMVENCIQAEKEIYLLGAWDKSSRRYIGKLKMERIHRKYA